MGCVVAAVSPAVIVPKMLRLMEEGRGTRAGIPQMIMAGASVDDVFVIVLFMAFTGLADGGGISAGTLARIPFSIVLGILAGAACGSLLAAVFRRLRLRDSAKVLILLSISFLLVTLEDSLSGRMAFPVSSRWWQPVWRFSGSGVRSPRGSRPNMQSFG